MLYGLIRSIFGTNRVCACVVELLLGLLGLGLVKAVKLSLTLSESMVVEPLGDTKDCSIGKVFRILTFSFDIHLLSLPLDTNKFELLIIVANIGDNRDDGEIAIA